MVSENQSLTIISKDASTNTARVRYTVTCTTSGESYNLSTQTGTFGVDGIGYTNDYTLPANTTTTVFDEIITINNASGKTVEATYSFPTTPYYGTRTGSTSVYIDLPRYATVDQRFSSKTINSITMNWSSDSIIDYVWYSINNGSSWIGIWAGSASSGNYTISGLSANTPYNIKTRVRRKDSQLTTDSSALNITTYNIGKITSSPGSFNLGDNLDVSYSLPYSGAGYQLCLCDRAGQIIYLPYRVISGTNTTLILSDEQLDEIYKKMGLSNSNSDLKFVLKTVCNGTTYYDESGTICNLTGNQKVIKLGNDGVKRGKLFIGINGVVRRAVIWVGDSNRTPRRGI